MSACETRSSRPLFAACTIALLLILASAMAAAAYDGGMVGPEQDASATDAAGPSAACSGGPTIDGVVLDECVENTFTVGGASKTIRVWYTKVQTPATRTVDGVTYNLQHWITTNAQAQDVADWMQEAWERYFADGGHHLYGTGCSRLNVRLEDGIGWAGIAYWGNSGSCWIGIDSPMIRNGGGQSVVYHEGQHYLQYSYDSGCYGYLRPNYPGDSEFVEGYADLAADGVDPVIDAQDFLGIGYNPEQSMYDEGYLNIFNKYFVEQLGTIGTPADPWHHMDAMYHHYEACDAADTLYVLDTLIPSLKPGMSEKRFFVDFFAANWAHLWADPATQPELVYTDDDGAPFGTLAPLRQNVTMNGGTQSWSESTPDDWAARYYEVRPQTGCPYLQVEVDGAAGAQLGINLMAADTSAPTSVLRSSVIGEDYLRTFAAAGVHDRIVAVVNSFANNYNYTVNFTCVTPSLQILEPRQTQFALVGEPASPIAFLARWSVDDGTNSVRGLPQSAFTFEAEGAPATVVAGSFQEVGDDYWAVLLPPTKPAGTTFVDFRVNLVAASPAVSDTEPDALLYVTPGSSNIAMSFDASGSMTTVDAAGEGSRLDNSKKAGQVIADLLRAGDRILVQDWSTDAGGVDVNTLLGRTDATTGNLATLIANTRTAIRSITARNMTPLGSGLKAAKDALVAAPANTNGNYIFLLSDGQENWPPMYADVRDEVHNAGIAVNTIAFGPEAPGDLMAQIAADTGGIYRPVATNGIGAGVAAEAAAAASAESAAALAALNSVDGGAQVAGALAAVPAPGPLGLADVYDYFDTEAQGAARVLGWLFPGTISQTIKTLDANVDESVNELRLVVAGKQPDDEGCVISDIRKVAVLPPGADPGKGWIHISPPSLRTPLPDGWDVRNNRFDDVLVVTDPAQGKWSFAAVYYPNNCLGLADSAGAEQAQLTGQVQDPEAASNGGPYDFFINVSVQSLIQLEGRLLGLTDGQGEAGDVVGIVGMLLGKGGLVTPDAMVAQVQGPGGTTLHLMHDDGTSGDGTAGDGIYGAKYSLTALGGGYGVRIVALFKDPANPANTLVREWNGGFWIKGPRPQQECGGQGDADKDCMPDEWERRCKLDTTVDDRNGDLDHDLLKNYDELLWGTLPCRVDTDNGGESDGSEVLYQRDPLFPGDDKIRPIVHIDVRPVNAGILVRWTHPLSYTNVLIFVTPDVNNLGDPINGGQGNTGNPGEFLVSNLQNGRQYWVFVVGEGVDDKNNLLVGDLSEPMAAMPKADPDMPSGTMRIAGDAPSTPSKEVMLDISATDTLLKGAADGSAAHMTDIWSEQINEVSGSVQVRVSDSLSMAGAQWQPVVQKMPWTLKCGTGDQCTVYAQFRDGAGNESLIISDSILLKAGEQNLRLYLPSIVK